MPRSSRRRSGRHGAKRRGHWVGIQWPLINVQTGGSFQEFTLPASLDNQAVTYHGVRGFISLSNSGADAATGGVEAACKIMKVGLNDAGTITDDTQALDLNIEDIMMRQLWTYAERLQTMGANADAGDIHRVQLEVVVKVDIKIEASLKEVLGLFIDASAANRLQSSGYLRTYITY